MLGNTTNQPFKNCAEINDHPCETYNINTQIKFVTTMLKSSLFNYSDAYIPPKGTMTVTNKASAEAATYNNNKKVIFKNYAPFIDCISEINNTQVDNAEDICTIYTLNRI